MDIKRPRAKRDRGTISAAGVGQLPNATSAAAPAAARDRNQGKVKKSGGNPAAKRLADERASLNRGASPEAEHYRKAIIALHRLDAKLSDATSVIVRGAHYTPEPIVFHCADLGWCLSLLRVNEIWDALYRGDPVDDGLREELLAMIAVILRLKSPKKKSSKASDGRKKPERAMQAAIVWHLINNGASPESALQAVTLTSGPDEKEKQRARDKVRKKYQALKKKGEPVRANRSAMRKAQNEGKF